MTIYTIKNDNIEISVNTHGAELCSLKDVHGNELLWQADEKFWPRHAPVLFPIVGRLNNDELKHNGKTYTMKQHGIARDREYENIENGSSVLSFRLRSDSASLQQYPFKFELVISYALIANRLMIVYTVRNHHDNDLPFSIGGHPAFNLPLITTENPEDYQIEFEQPESQEIYQLEDGLIAPALRPSPLNGTQLNLSPGLFDNDALIFPELNSSKVFYGNDNGKGLTVSFAGFPDLGIWSKPNAPFVCIEPWAGHSSPLEYDGEFKDKPGILILPPYSERSLSYSIEVDT